MASIIAILLMMSPSLSIADDYILLDRDILYWKPAGPDVELPDVYYHPALISYTAAVFDGIFYPVLSPVNSKNTSPDAEISPEDEEKKNYEWEPPQLIFQTPLYARDITFYGSYPYGWGASFGGDSGLFAYHSSGQFNPWDDYPSWLKGEVGFDYSKNHMLGILGLRTLEEKDVLSLFQWNAVSEGPRWSISRDLQFKNILSLAAPGDHSWAASVNASLKNDNPHFNFFLSLESEYYSQSGTEGWRIAPGLSVGKVFSFFAGDLSLALGGEGGLYTDDLQFVFFPDFKILFRQYGALSFFIETKAVGISESELFSFHLEENYSEPEIRPFHWQQSKTGVYFTLGQLKGYTSAGLNQGTLAMVSKGSLIQEKTNLLFSELNLGGQFFRGIIMELNSYADYLDKGKWRFLVIYRIVAAKKEHSPSFSFHAGNRELVRGSGDFYYTESDTLYGIGFQLEFTKGLKLSSSLDYAVFPAHIEGGAALTYSF